MLVIVNTQFMLVQALQHYKLFSNSTSLWIIDSSLLLVVGHSLAVVPFVLDTERLCALIGSHKPLHPSGVKVRLIVVIFAALSMSLHPLYYIFLSLVALFFNRISPCRVKLNKFLKWRKCCGMIKLMSNPMISL